MPPTSIDADLESELAAIAEGAGCELVHAEFRSNVLRVFIDRPEEGVTLQDCETVSREISAFLDVQDFGQRKYLLEVSSPGLDRQLYRPRDYQRFQGRQVRVKFRVPGSAGKKTVVGELEEFHPGHEGNGGGEISVREPSSGERHRIRLGDVEVARLEIEL